MQSSQEQLDDRNLPKVKTDKCGPHGNACYQENNLKCGKIVWDEPFYKEECEFSGRQSDNGVAQRACEKKYRESSDYINIDMLEVNKEGTQTIYKYNCEDPKFSKTGLCKDMMKSSDTCNCKSGEKIYSVFGGGGSTTKRRQGGVFDTTEYHSVLRLHVECKKDKMSWGVTADTCEINSNYDMECKENRRGRRRRLLHDGGKRC